MPFPSRRSFLSHSAAALAASACALPAATPRPNIVVVLVDDMGFSDLGCYGSEIPTPNLDKLAANGLRFTQFYNTARCSPSRAALLTGLYPHNAGMGHLDNLIQEGSRGYTGRLSDECVTMAEVLGGAGYGTSMTGKWHLGQKNGTPPWKRGFDGTLNAIAGGIYFPRQKTGPKGTPIELFLNGRSVASDSSEVGDSWYSPDLWTDFALRFIDESIQKKKPFFHYLAHNAPHFPLMAPPEDIAKFRGKFKEGWDKLREKRYARQTEMGLIKPAWRLTERPPESPAWDSLTPEQQDRFDHMMAIYAAILARIDRSIGTLVEGLRTRGVLENTLILFLSDNGGNAEAGPDGRTVGDHWGDAESNVFLGMNWATLNNTPFRRYKHFSHEGGIATPLIAHWPAGIPAARRGTFEHQPGHLVDIMSTAVDITGAPYPTVRNGHKILPQAGTSLAPAFKGQKLKRTEPIFFFHEGNRGVRSGKWKLVAKYMGPWELYDMDADRTELRDRIAEQPALAKNLAARWDAWAARTHGDAWIGPVRNAWGEEVK